ncbi:MAG: 3-isopropylmalate dehydratase small subunit [Acidobacteriota bacterium]
MEAFRTIRSRTVALPIENIDTDQIIPAQFLKVTDRAGLGKGLFHHWRYEKDGLPRPGFFLNRPEAEGAQVLVAGDNFGSGSSREHAPWALLDSGFRAVVSTSFASIFMNNALKNGLLPIIVEGELHRRLLASPGEAVVIDLEKRTISLEDGTQAQFPIDPFARHCLLNGIDQLSFLLDQEKAIAAYERRTSARSR